MTAWLQTFAVIAVIICSTIAAYKLSTTKGNYWLIGYGLSLVFILILAAVRFYVRLNFIWPISWLMIGRVRFVVFAIFIPLGIITPLPKLRTRRAKVALVSLMSVTLCWFAIMPFLSAAVMRPYFSSIGNRIDTDGVCFQTTNYTCGPAAAVTALKRLDLPAHEGTLAVLAYTTPMTGTIPSALARAIKQQYADTDLEITYEYLLSIDQLATADVSLVMVKSSLLSDHCIAVLEVTPENVTYADPVYGVHTITRSEFKQIWRSMAILLSRPSLAT